MARNIVVCCDGTGNEFGEDDTNVLKIHRVVKRDPGQITYYDPGLGTMGRTSGDWPITKKINLYLGLAFGFGLSGKVQDAYQFLMNEYEPGDQVYIFGFSRGAYTARVLAGFLHRCGLLERGLDTLIPYAMKIYADPKNGSIPAEFKKTFSRDCPLHLLGLWDTVRSVGWAYSKDLGSLPNTRDNPSVSIVCHAVSLDERRCKFRQNLWTSTPPPTQRVDEVWFPGVHCDVGGGYPEKESGLSKIALEWMVNKAEAAGLRIDPEQRLEMLPRASGRYAAPDVRAELHNSLTGAWWVLEFLPLPHKVRTASGEWKTRLQFYRGRPRDLGERPTIHWSVEARMKLVPGYAPKNLPPRYDVEGPEIQARSA